MDLSKIIIIIIIIINCYGMLSHTQSHKNIFGSKKLGTGFHKGCDNVPVRLSRGERGVASREGKRKTGEDMGMLVWLRHKKKIEDQSMRTFIVCVMRHSASPSLRYVFGLYKEMRELVLNHIGLSSNSSFHFSLFWGGRWKLMVCHNTLCSSVLSALPPASTVSDFLCRARSSIVCLHPSFWLFPVSFPQCPFPPTMCLRVRGVPKTSSQHPTCTLLILITSL